MTGVRRDLDRQSQPVKPISDRRVEVQDVVAYLDTEIRTLNDVEGACHHAKVNSLGFGSTLGVINVAPERADESLPRALWVEPCQSAGMCDEAQRRTVRSAAVVVINRSADQVIGVLVPQSCEQVAQFCR